MNIKPLRPISDKTVEEVKYATAKRKRQEHEDAVLNSPSNKKIVVAGPGTGKTYLFKMILEEKKNNLTLSFVNALIEDLSLKLCGISDVKTLHGFARGVLEKYELKKAEKKKIDKKEIEIFPKLSKVIMEDAKILLENEIDFDELFHNRDDNNMHIDFYKKRKDYYSHYGFSDIVFGAVKLFEQRKDEIPTYEQVVVDEFQDFNKLEVSLIDLLAEKSHILLAGDDDQALYMFKHASPKYIRERYSDKTPEYISFELPYCLRCTRVIVDAANNIIKSAKEEGCLCRRIKKPFEYFDDPDKDKVSDENPQIIYRQLQWSQIPTYINIDIEHIAKQVRDIFTVLIICPTNLQCRTVVNSLRKKGFVNVNFTEKEETKELTLLDGLKLLLKERNCNLGWRIVSKKLLKHEDFARLLEKTNNDDAIRFFDLIEQDQKNDVSQMLHILRSVRDEEVTGDDELADLLKRVGIDAYAMATDFLKDEIKSCMPPSQRLTLANPEIRKIPITITTIQRSKGLAADYVFVAYFDDKYLLTDNKVSDQDICKFLVALTRSRRKAFLFSSDTTKRPVFLSWINRKYIKEIKLKDKSTH